ncbi:MAG: thermonuclease family protein [Planctomycetes bacterium]|nr:thermonuclease family protein [Planctomycetota bacterium]
MKKQQTKSRSRIIPIAIATVALLSLGAAGYLYTHHKSAPEEAPNWLEIKQVRSGDTLILKHGEKLMYRGIQAPAEGEPLFDEARRRNEAFVVDKQVRARFEQDAERDKKDRLLAYAFVDKQLVNAELVREGLAYARITTDTTRYNQEILAPSAAAQKAKRGVWSLPAPAAESEYWADPKYGLFHGAACAQRGKAKPERIQTVRTRLDAFAHGWAPCGECKP